MAALNRGYLVTTIIAAILFAIAAWAMLQPPAASGADAWTWLRFWLCGLAGMITAFLYVWITQYTRRRDIDPCGRSRNPRRRARRRTLSRASPLGSRRHGFRRSSS